MNIRTEPEAMQRLADTAKAASYTVSGGTTMVGALSLNEWAALIGIVMAIATFGVTWYYNHRTHQLRKQRSAREIEEHEAYMEEHTHEHHDHE